MCTLKKCILPAVLALAMLMLAACDGAAVLPAAGQTTAIASTEAPTPDPTPSPTPEPTPTPTPEPTPTPTPEPTPKPPYTMPPKGEIGPDTFYIYVEKGSHTVTIYSKDENGEYTNVVYSFLAATGRTALRTPVGNFVIMKTKDRWHTFSLENGGHTYTQYATAFDVGDNRPTGRLFFHAGEYTSKDIDRLDREFYDAIGTDDTAGCLRMCAYGAWWIYTYCPAGTKVEIVNGNPKGTQANRPPDPVKGEGKYDLYDATDPGLPPEFGEFQKPPY